MDCPVNLCLFLPAYVGKMISKKGENWVVYVLMLCSELFRKQKQYLVKNGINQIQRTGTSVFLSSVSVISVNSLVFIEC